MVPPSPSSSSDDEGAWPAEDRAAADHGAAPGDDGGSTDFTIPLLIGFSLYVQNLNVNPSSPPGQLTNLAQTEFK